MAVLSFSLTQEATGRLYELLTCLAKFGDTVSLEARSEKACLRECTPSSNGDRFTCQLFNKSLQSVFKGRTQDAIGKNPGIERCDVTVQDQDDKAECRLVVKMRAKHGMTKTFRLTYESSEVMHALFDRTTASQGFRISSRVMREYVEYFHPKTEQLDLLAQDGKVVLTSFTDKVQDGKEVLKQPLETAIAIHTEDFEDFHMQEGMHIIISVKDFRAIVTHAETLRGPIHAYFSYPNRPLQFSYQNHGIHCEFTLMTTGDRGASASSNNSAPKFVSTRPNGTSSRQPSAVPSQRNGRSNPEMPPPGRPSAGRPLASQSQRMAARDRPRPTAITVEDDDPDPESLFIPTAGGDDDQTWDPPDYEQDDDEMLGWDASNDNFSASIRPTIRDLSS
ncbi:uncharacterized protein MYCFIDRAFT_14840, partial [Pseudocercospora fijiensis CIRAD86]